LRIPDNKKRELFKKLQDVGYETGPDSRAEIIGIRG
jgi:hypothetical protein